MYACSLGRQTGRAAVRRSAHPKAAEAALRRAKRGAGGAPTRTHHACPRNNKRPPPVSDGGRAHSNMRARAYSWVSVRLNVPWVPPTCNP